MKKRVLSLALLCCFAPPFGLIHAAETEQAEFLVLKMADSKTAEFKLSTRPVIAFSEDKLQITSDEISTDYPQSDVTEFYFTAISTGIEEKVNPSTMSLVTPTTPRSASAVLRQAKLCSTMPTESCYSDRR